MGSRKEIKEQKEVKTKRIREEVAIVSPATNVVLDNLVKSMYDAAMKLQEIQSSFSTPVSRAAVLGMSADISKMLMRFRKITSAIKTGDDKRIEKSIEESKLRNLIAELIAEELNKR